MIDKEVTKLAKFIALSCHDEWCGWDVVCGCAEYRVGTNEYKDGDRVWVPVARVSLEHLELILTYRRSCQAKALYRIVNTIKAKMLHLEIPS